MRVRLEDIPDIRMEWQTVHRIKALVINGRSPALNALAAWKQSNEQDYKRLLRSIKLACTNERILGGNHVKACKNKRFKGVYELIAHRGKPRLFFFYSEDEEEIIVCSHGWDKKTSRKEQNAEFEKCHAFMKLFQEHRYDT